MTRYPCWAAHSACFPSLPPGRPRRRMVQREMLLGVSHVASQPFTGIHTPNSDADVDAYLIQQLSAPSLCHSLARKKISSLCFNTFDLNPSMNIQKRHSQLQKQPTMDTLSRADFHHKGVEARLGVPIQHSQGSLVTMGSCPAQTCIVLIEVAIWGRPLGGTPSH